MNIKLGARGSSDQINYILIKIDDLTLMTAENLFLSGEEYRIKAGKSIVALLNSLSKDHAISIGENIVDNIEDELKLGRGELKKYSSKCK